jgi:hypothetical protein
MEMGEITLKLEVPTGLEDRYKSSGLDGRIWSNNPEFKEMVEDRVPVVSTSELKEELELEFTTTP